MDQIKEWLGKLWQHEEVVRIGVRILGFIGVLIGAWVADYVTKKIVLAFLRKFIKQSKASWDDAFVERRFFSRLCHLVPAVIIYVFGAAVFKSYPNAVEVIHKAAIVYIAVVVLMIFDALLNSLVDIYRGFEFSRRMPIRGFVQVGKIIIFLFTVIIVISIILEKKPNYLLGGLGAMTAVILLIFKDSILGLVAGIQLSSNQMIHIGDWIEMPKYGADGDVIDISLTTVKVRNWDKTIVTIPTYSLVSDSFKNWRGMSESGGRRIKRSICIDMTSVKFCTAQMLDKFRKYRYISDYIEKKSEEIAKYNASSHVDDSELVNGRRLTNIGTFRAYVVAYLRNHPKVHQDMTFLVRHLEPTPYGLPIEIYVFSNDQVWANYEAIQADIFDHILAVIPQFDLRVFQNPTGSDFQHLHR